MIEEYVKVQQYCPMEDGTYGFKTIELSPEFDREWRKTWNSFDWGSKYPEDSL